MAYLRQHEQRSAVNNDNQKEGELMDEHSPQGPHPADIQDQLGVLGDGVVDPTRGERT